MKRSSAILKLLPLFILALPLQLAWADSGLDISGDDGAFDTALSDDQLAGQRGMALVTNTNDLDGYVYENSASDLVTGYNVVSDGSLAGNAGLATVIQNSGNNVLIQNATILNVQVQ
jgi:hypothetical protein